MSQTNRSVIHTHDAPAAVGPYSQAIRSGDLVLTAGQIGLLPGSGALVEGGVEAETRQVLANLQAVLEAAGSSPAKVLKTTIFLTDMADFKAVNAIYGEVFTTDPPARSTVAVAALPLGARVEIEAVATAS
jgi:2-iminobutanoate/2-iminopropanoate deaminase